MQPTDLPLSEFLRAPGSASARKSTLWRSFSFAAAHDALRMGADPALDGADLSADVGMAKLAGLIRRVKRAAARGTPVHNSRPAGYELRALQPSIPPLLGRALASFALLPLARCENECGGAGWCAPGAAIAPGGASVSRRRPLCGCFVPGGLVARVGGTACADRSVWRSDRQPSPHWGPSCPSNCSGRGECDWQGFCRCSVGVWGIDCAIARGGGDASPTLDLPTFEERAAAGPHAPKPLTPLRGLLGLPPEREHSRDRVRGAERRIARSAAGGAGPRPPLIYVIDMPPLLRFGVDFAAHVESSLSERLLRSAHRAPTVEQADYLWMPGAPLVIDGHRLLARLYHVAQHWLPADSALFRNASEAVATEAPATGRIPSTRTRMAPPLVLMPLLTERASMDSFQLSYADDDREEWPQLARAEHVRAILSYSPNCGMPLETPPFVGPASAGADAEGGGLAAAEQALASALAERRRRVGRAMLLGLFAGGGHDSFLRSASAASHIVTSHGIHSCPLPRRFLPSSSRRLWAGVQ